jgi:regulation of enolase protein 1 (concanavalin A-like superfamily)
MNHGTEEIAAAGVRERLAMYQEECKKKKDMPRREEKPVGALEPDKTDIQKFMTTPSKTPITKVVINPGRLSESLLFDFESSAHVDDDDNALESSHRSSMVSTLRPGMMRGNSFDGAEPDMSDVYGTSVRRGGYRPDADLSLRPGSFRGSSFDDDKPKEVKDEEESKAKEHVLDILNQFARDSGDSPEDMQVSGFTAMKDRYLTAIEQLRPEPVDHTLMQGSENKEEAKRSKKEKLREEADKMTRYEDLKKQWIEYEAAAQDKPAIPSEIAEEIKKREADVADAWTDFAEKIVEEVQENSESDSSDEDHDLAQWIAEAKRLKLEKELRANAQKKEDRRKRREEHQKMLESEDADIIEAARQLKAKATKNAAVKDVEEVSADEESIGDIAGELEREKKESTAYLNDSSGDEADDDRLGMNKSFVKHKVRNNQESLSTLGSQKDKLVLSDTDSDSDAAEEPSSNSLKQTKKGSPSAFLDSSDEETEDESLGMSKSFSKFKTRDLPSDKKSSQWLAKTNSKSKIDDESDDDSEAPNAGDKKLKKKKNKEKDKEKKKKDKDSKKKKETESKSKKTKVTKEDDSDNETQKRKNKEVKKKNKEKAPSVELGTVEKLEIPVAALNPDGTNWKDPFKAWMNKPKKVKIEGARINVRVPEKTDCWRKTRHNFIMDNAPFYWHKIAGDFEVVCKISGGFEKMYDKAGLMIRQDEENWIMSGMECFNDQMNHSTCITRDYTDWSLAPLPENSEKVGIWFAIKRLGDAIETFYSIEGKKWIQTRQGLFSSAPVLKVGIVCACPMGDPFKVNFDMYRCKNI